MVGMAKPYTNEVVSEILADRAAGVSTKETAKRLGITVAGAYNVLKKASVQARPMKRQVHADDATKTEIKRLFEVNGLSIPDISTRVGRSTPNVRAILRSLGCPTPTKAEASAVRHIKTPDEERQIVSEYADVEKRVGLSERWGLPNGYLYRILARHGIDADHRQIPVREDAFDLPISDEASYWAGFLMADGYIQRDDIRGARIELDLAREDLDVVESFRDFLGASHSISRRQISSGVESNKISIRSERLADALGVLGVGPGKTNNEKAGDAVALSNDFWRGHLDGDGCYYATGEYPMVQNLGSAVLLEQFRSWARSVGVDITTNILFHNGIHLINVNGEKAYRLCIALDSSNSHLKRKNDKRKLIISRFSGKYDK